MGVFEFGFTFSGVWVRRNAEKCVASSEIVMPSRIRMVE